jgi:cellulose synthase/poly-beta-1,6-N-acetylglucosamine synthase-like glycosyltransferase
MTLALLAQVSATVAFVCAGISLCFLLGDLYLVVLHLRLRRDGLAREAALLATPPPPDSELPHVVVQITVCNEGPVVTRAILAAAQLDWPRDKLHIQICDDSDDETTELARAAIAPVVQSGIDMRILRRKNRTEYKAGNLRAAMAESTRDYFVIFDVDYVPPPDFLRKCMPPLIADPALAFVQARPDFLNADENAVTRAAALHLDAHHAIEQATRCWAGHPLQFNGTCGIWRRAAIESCGGWSGATMLEDVDLGYRAAFNGWSALFLMSVSAPGELPATPRVWVLQQRRWKVGLLQNARLHVPRLLADPKLSFAARLGGLLHLGTLWWAPPVGRLMLLAACMAAVLEPGWLPLFVGVQVAFIVAVHLEQCVHLRVGQRSVRGSAVSFRRFLTDCVQLSMLISWIEITSIGATWRRLIGRSEAFRRTPTTGNPGWIRPGGVAPAATAPLDRSS